MKKNLVNAVTFIQWGKPLFAYKQGRKCRNKGCRTILNIYNPHRECYACRKSCGVKE